MVKKILFHDTDSDVTSCVSKINSIFGVRDGIFSTIDRVREVNSDALLYYFHPNVSYAALICQRHNLICVKEEPNLGDYDQFLYAKDLEPSNIIEKLGDQIIEDVGILYNSARNFVRGSDLELLDGVFVIGRLEDLIVHNTAEVLPGTIFDVRHGPIVLAAESTVGQHSFLQGPIYVGEESAVEFCKLSGPVVVGRQCRLGGELEASVVGDFSNKHHEGFIGHSILGDWVNIGALATTSDLKNNYGRIRLRFSNTQNDGHDVVHYYDTNRIKFGSIVGDCVKVGIGTMINTGSVIEFGSNVFGGNPPKYMKPFSWGLNGEKYEYGRFIDDCASIFSRRGQSVDKIFKEISELLYRQTKFDSIMVK